MNLIQSVTGYYYKSPQRFEAYTSAKILFMQQHFGNIEVLHNEEIVNIKKECDSLKIKYSKHIETIGYVYLYFFLMVFVAVFFVWISNNLINTGFIYLYVRLLACLSTVLILLVLWGGGYWKAGKGQRLVRRIETQESFIQCYSQINNKRIPQGIKGKELATRNIVLSVINLFYTNKVIEVIDEKLLTMPFVSIEILSPLSQVQLVTYLVYFLREGKIKIKDSSSYKSLAECLSQNMEIEEGVLINIESFNVAFNRVHKSNNDDFERLKTKHLIDCIIDDNGVYRT